MNLDVCEALEGYSRPPVKWALGCDMVFLNSQVALPGQAARYSDNGAPGFFAV